MPVGGFPGLPAKAGQGANSATISAATIGRAVDRVGFDRANVVPLVVDRETPAKAALAPVCIAKIETRRASPPKYWVKSTGAEKPLATVLVQISNRIRRGTGNAIAKCFLEMFPQFTVSDDHCREAIKAANCKLRSLISQAEGNQILTLADPIDAMHLLGADLPRPRAHPVGVAPQFLTKKDAFQTALRHCTVDTLFP